MSSGTLPGSVGLPIVGETIPFLRDIKQFLDHRIAKHGPFFRTSLLGSLTAISCTYSSTLEMLLPSTQQPPHHLPLDAAGAYKEFMAPLYPSPNLLLSQDAHPLRASANRQLHSFLTASVSNYIPTVRRIIHTRIQALAESNPTSLRPYSFFKSLTERIVTTVILGTLTEEDYLNIRKLCSYHFNGIVAAPVHVEAFGARSARATAVHAYSQLIQIIEARLRHSIKHHDEATILSALASELRHSDATEQQISEAAQLVLVLLSTAVPKALASALSSTTRLLSQQSHAQLQRLVLHEAELDKTHALDGILMETLRMYPPLPGGMRQSHGACVGGRQLPKRCRVWYSALHSNRDKAVYERAEQFFPQRWAGVGETAVGCPFAIPGGDAKVPTPLTFGAGERHCKGRDLAWVIMRESVISLLKQFEVVGGPVREEELRFVPVLRPTSDTSVHVKPR